MFQSSPAADGGCNFVRIYLMVKPNSFQSSPAADGGCNQTSDNLTVSAQGFQSSPAADGGCNSPATPAVWPRVCFNPHPPRTAGATVNSDSLRLGGAVSILTRRGRRVQPK